MKPLPLSVHTVAQVRALERHAIQALHIPSYVLMTRAGEAALTALRQQWPRAQRIAVVCGPGNNGGDGYVLARLALVHGMQVTVSAPHDPQHLQGDARRAWQDYLDAGGIVQQWAQQSLTDAEVVVDALFGIGLTRAVEGLDAQCIAAINASGVPVLALDVPSGLHADSGEVMGVAVHAQCTSSFIGLKLGFYLGQGPDYVGRLFNDELGVPLEVADGIGSAACRIDAVLLSRVLLPRPRTAHKMQQGRVLVIGGGPGMAGAARMAAEAALRVGAGLVTVATAPQSQSVISAGRPELMCHAVTDAAQATALIERADVLAVGPGLGRDDWARALLQAAMAAGKPMVVDADALTLLADEYASAPINCNAADWILTPHPGEAGRLLGCSAQAVQADRLAAVHEIRRRYGATAVLKGAATLVLGTGDELPGVCDRGNPGMATPGMGDVLTGVIAGILAQCGVPAQAARVGVLVHAMAGDLAAQCGERGLLATDLFDHLRGCVNPGFAS